MRRIQRVFLVRGKRHLVRPPSATLVGSLEDSRLGWFVRIWEKARSDAAVSPPSDSTETAASLSHQLLKLYGDPGAQLPHHVTVALWNSYRTEPAEGVVPSLEASPLAQASLSRSKLHRIDFFLTIAQLGIDMPSVAKECSNFVALAQSSAAAEAVPDSHSLPTIRRSVGLKAKDLRVRLVPLYERWFQRSLALPDGAKRLLDMRADLLALQAEIETLAKGASTPTAEAAVLRRACDAIRPVEDALTDTLREWCSVAWLVIDEMTWSKTPALVVSQIVDHEAVHPFKNMEDVRRRMWPSPHRHAYAFFHPNVVGEPLAMVFVALTVGIANSVGDILRTGGEQGPALNFSHVEGSHPIAPPSPAAMNGLYEPDTAIFYSITATQAGLRGVELGGFLIKSVVSELRSKRPNIKQFSTLSPIPGYVKWFKRRLATVPVSNSELTLGALFNCPAVDVDPKLPSRLLLALGRHVPIQVDAVQTNLSLACRLVELFLSGIAWWLDGELTSLLEPIILASVYHYLTEQTQRGRPIDPVAKFHLKNGALLHRLNWLGHASPEGSRSSACVMVNYHYDFAALDRNAMAFAEEGRIALSPTILSRFDAVRNVK